jgi:hypothetical protein
MLLFLVLSKKFVSSAIIMNEFQFLYDEEYHVKPVFAGALVISCFTAIFVDLEHGCKHRIFYRCLVKKR